MSLRDDLKAYLDGELAPSRMEEMQSALERDPALKKEYLELKSIGDGLSRYAARPEAQGLENTLRALQTNRRRSWNFGLLWLPVSVAAAACAVVFFIRSGTKMDESGDAGLVASNYKADNMRASTASPDAADAPAAPAPQGGRLAEPQAMAKSDPTLGGIQSNKPATKKVAKNELPSWRSRLREKQFTASPSKSAVETREPLPQTVVLAFDSPEIGEKKVLDLVGRYRVASTGTVLFTDDAKAAVPPITEEPKTIVVEVPEAAAESTLRQLNGLPVERPVAMRGGGGGRGGVAGGFGGAGAPGGAGPSGGAFGSAASKATTASGATSQPARSFGAYAKRPANTMELPATKSTAANHARDSMTVTHDADSMPSQKMRRIVIRIVKKQPPAAARVKSVP